MTKELTTGKEELRCNKKKLKCLLISEKSLVDLWPAKIEEKDILLWQIITNVNPRLDEYLLWVCGMSREAPVLLSVVLQHCQALPLSWDRHTSRLLPSSSSSSASWVPKLSTSPLCSILVFSFPGNPGCHQDPGFKETCQKEKIQFPPQSMCLTADLVVLLDPPSSEHSDCPQSTASAWMITSQREQQPPPGHHLVNLLQHAPKLDSLRVKSGQKKPSQQAGPKDHSCTGITLPRPFCRAVWAWGIHWAPPFIPHETQWFNSELLKWTNTSNWFNYWLPNIVYNKT